MSFGFKGLILSITINDSELSRLCDLNFPPSHSGIKLLAPLLQENCKYCLCYSNTTSLLYYVCSVSALRRTQTTHRALAPFRVITRLHTD
jgi:hypothetical protein